MNFLQKHNIIFNHQDGFRKIDFINHAFNDILTECYNNIECKKYTV